MIRTRNIRIFDKGAFLADAAKTFWKRVINPTDDVDSMFEMWSFFFFAFVEKHAPLTGIRVSDKNCL